MIHSASPLSLIGNDNLFSFARFQEVGIDLGIGTDKVYKYSDHFRPWVGAVWINSRSF